MPLDSPSDVVLMTPTGQSLRAPHTWPVSHLKPSSSCEPQMQCTSSARFWYAPPRTATPAAAVAAVDVQPESWSQNTTAKLWLWVPLSSRVSRRLDVVITALTKRGWKKDKWYQETLKICFYSLLQTLRKRRKSLKCRTRPNLKLL